MRTTCFIAPFLLDATLKYIQAAASVPGTRLIVLTQDGPGRLPPGAHHWKVDNATDAGQLIAAAREVAATTGGIHRVIGILENVQEQIAMVREALGIPGPDVATAERFRDKAIMKTTLRAAGLPCARHRLLQSVEDALGFVAEVGYPIVVKPPDGAGCKATYQVGNEADLRIALAESRPGIGREVLAEEFIKGEEHSYDTIVINGRVVFRNVLRYLPGPLDVMRNDWIQWCALAPRDIGGKPFEAIKKAGDAAVSALGLRTGMTHMEWFRRKDGSPVISEVGARPPGAQFTSVMSYVCDRSLYHAWAHAVIDDHVEGDFERKYSAGIAFLRGPGQGRVSLVEGVEEAQRAVGRLVVEARLPVVGNPKSSSYEGDGFAIVRHPDTAVVEEALGTLIRTIRVHYA